MADIFFRITETDVWRMECNVMPWVVCGTFWNCRNEMFILLGMSAPGAEQILPTDLHDFKMHIAIW